MLAPLLRTFALLAIVATVPRPAWSQEQVTAETRVEADGTTTLAHQVLIDAPASEVWAAIATPEGWKTWAVPSAWWMEGEPGVLETSYDPADKPGSASTIRQRFLLRVPNRLLAFRTIKAPEGFPNWETYQGVTSVFELEPAGSATRVRLTSVGYPDSDAGRELVGFFTRGNAETLQRLQAGFAGN